MPRPKHSGAPSTIECLARVQSLIEQGLPHATKDSNGAGHHAAEAQRLEASLRADGLARVHSQIEHW